MNVKSLVVIGSPTVRNSFVGVIVEQALCFRPTHTTSHANQLTQPIALVHLPSAVHAFNVAVQVAIVRSVGIDANAVNFDNLHCVHFMTFLVWSAGHCGFTMGSARLCSNDCVCTRKRL